MKASLMACGLVVALVGCSGMDNGYAPPPNRNPMYPDRSMPPPPTAANWQQYNRGGYGSTGQTLLPGGSFGSTPQAGAMTAMAPAPTDDSLRMSQSSPPRTMSPYANSLASAPPATPAYTPPAAVPAQRDPMQGEISTPSIQRVSYEQIQPPLRGISSDSLPQRDALKSSSTPSLVADPKPLLMAVPEQHDKPLIERVPAQAPEKVAAADTTPAVNPMSSAESVTEEKVTSPCCEKTAGQSAPAHKMVNSKHIVLNYKLDDVGPSGVSAIEMWWTRDGRTWQKDETPGHKGPPYVFEVPEEGTYGFTMVARNGIGLGKEPPKSGDLPQVWVEVDMTRPTVSLIDVKHGEGVKAREVTIQWEAHDRNLAGRPITLSFATSPEGPWLPFAANIENTGHYNWSMPQSGPVSFYTRVEAVDVVGNVGVAQSAKATSIDTSHPTVSILEVESGDKDK
jgi:hypothetical protein